MKNINWKVFLILWVAAVLSTLALIPYALELQSSLLADLELPIPLPALIALQTVQNAILFAVMIASGLWLAHKVGLGTPILDAMTRRESTGAQWSAILPVSILFGVIAGLLIIGLDVLVFHPMLMNELGSKADALAQSAQPAAWKGFLASFYGGIAEEIQLRLLVMTLFVWLGSFVSKTAEGKPSNGVFWFANIAAAVLFGLGHLPATANLLPLTPLVIMRAIVLNGVGGLIFGWLYWKRGLESAMVAHFSADIVLHVLFAL